jgi:hypothetical protein
VRVLFYILGFLLPLSVLLNGCKEVYFPEVDQVEPAIVVEGLLTDQEQQHLVKLHYSMGFNAYLPPQPVTGARVEVADHLGNIFTFIESQPGHYYSAESFAGQYGHVYTLHIETARGEVLRSGQQELLPPAPTDSIFGQPGVYQYVEQTFDGRFLVRTYEGVETFINIHNTGDSFPKVRYSPRILLLYGYWTQLPFQGDVFVYRWKKFADRTLPSVNFLGWETGYAGIRNHRLTHLPRSRYYYGIDEEEDIIGKYVLYRQYRLNDASHAFYKSMVKQLSGDGNLFDPIAAQLAGNMTCISDPDLKVFGLFEASSTISETYWVIDWPDVNRIEFFPFEDLDHVASEGTSVGVAPFFWQTQT